MTDMMPPLILGPELLAHMRKRPESELTKLARNYIRLALAFTGEEHLFSVDETRARGLKPQLSISEMAELTRDLRKINEKLEGAIAEAGKPPRGLEFRDRNR